MVSIVSKKNSVSGTKSEQFPMIDRRRSAMLRISRNNFVFEVLNGTQKLSKTDVVLFANFNAVFELDAKREFR